MDNKDIAVGFMLFVIQAWDQSPEQRVGALNAALKASGIKAQAAAWNGGSFTFEGKDQKDAKAWLHNCLLTMNRGDFNVETAHVQRCITEGVPA